MTSNSVILISIHDDDGDAAADNNNNRICIAQVCQMTSEALDGQLQSCYTARARPKCPTNEKCFRLRLNRARELQHKVSVTTRLKPTFELVKTKIHYTSSFPAAFHSKSVTSP